MARNELAEKLDVMGGIFEIDGMTELLAKFDKDMGNVKFSAVIFQIEGLLLKNSPETANKLVAMNRNINEKDAEKMEDAEYANALKDAIIADVMGFFVSSPHSDGRK